MVSSPTVSIVCVYNNAPVREECLDRSIRMLSPAEGSVEYIPIDNLERAFPSAGAALNHGVSLASGDYIAFAHQDVFLHSLNALRAAASEAAAGNFGLIGAVGITSEGRMAGRIRDRVVLVGDAVTKPVDVDSVDEVLFLAPRSQLLSDPLTESADMAWHAYAVEYGLRMRSQGLRTGAADIPLTHNSLTINLDRLDVAHQVVASRFTDLLPVRTTCGVIAKPTRKRATDAWLDSQRWRYLWLRESLSAYAARGARKYTAVILADIRRDVDDIISRAPQRCLHILNVSHGRPFPEGDSVEFSRRDGRVTMSSCARPDVPAILARDAPDSGSWLLITNLRREDVVPPASWLPDSSAVLGFHEGIGFWLLVGPSTADLPPQWRSRRATPLGRRLAAAESAA
jgi:hypothetical protein